MSDLTHQWTTESIMNFLHDNRARLSDLGVEKIGLFGSFARGEQTPDSDMDFVFTMNNMTYTRWMDVWNFLEDNFACKVNLVPEKDLRDELRPQILAEVKYVPQP